MQGAVGKAMARLGVGSTLTAGLPTSWAAASREVAQAAAWRQHTPAHLGGGWCQQQICSPAAGAVRAASSSSSSSSSGGASGKSQDAPTPRRPQLDERIGFIGAGQMGEALIRGFLESKVSRPSKISASVRTFERQALLESLGIGKVFEDAGDGGAQAVAECSDVIFLGVKPQAMKEVLAALGPHVSSRHLIVSIAAGVKIESLQAALGDSRVVRVMPNTPCLIQKGASAYALGASATERDGEVVRALLSSVGFCIQIQEKEMDAVTGLSGSGPAFVYIMIEAMADGGVAAGLPRDTAYALAAHTVSGAAQMLFSGVDDVYGGSLLGMMHPGWLKDKVASPAGTTIAGLMELENSGVRGAFIRAVNAAANRSKELSKES